MIERERLRSRDLICGTSYHIRVPKAPCQDRLRLIAKTKTVQPTSAASQQLCPKGSMVAFPERAGRERREGPYKGQNPRRKS